MIPKPKNKTQPLRLWSSSNEDVQTVFQIDLVFAARFLLGSLNEKHLGKLHLTIKNPNPSFWYMKSYNVTPLHCFFLVWETKTKKICESMWVSQKLSQQKTVGKNKKQNTVVQEGVSPRCHGPPPKKKLVKMSLQWSRYLTLGRWTVPMGSSTWQVGRSYEFVEPPKNWPLVDLEIL